MENGILITIIVIGFNQHEKRLMAIVGTSLLDGPAAGSTEIIFIGRIRTMIVFIRYIFVEHCILRRGTFLSPNKKVPKEVGLGKAIRALPVADTAR